MRVVGLHGLRIRSALPLPGAPLPDGDAVDLVVERGEDRHVPAAPPDGELLARADLGDGRGYAHARTADGYVFRFHSLVEFVLTPDLDRATVHRSPEAPVGFEEVLLAGSILAAILLLRGECVLHASTVRLDGTTLAFVGPSGAGKSTVAALLCADGARLVTDDVLRLALAANGAATCFAGAPAIRLRDKAAALAEPMSEDDPETSPDGRTVATAKPVEGAVPLDVIIFPLPSREATTLHIERLRPQDTLLSLARAPRIVGWQHPPTRRAEFEHFGRLAGAIPAFRATIPWGPPFPDDLGRRLLGALDSAEDP